ncbi:family A G protein-coupled receptor-like protein [Neoconidiobolus thromboides FSU 785]|nr:family A G protein-coupled receptor-like protein [Neoconidiobolus thromboides FSU 785]
MGYAGEIVLLIQALIGIMINCLMFYIIVIKLSLKGTDLKLILLIGILDCLFYINSVVRISLMTSFNQDTTLFPNWWCASDTSITIITMESSLELVAILGLMRYFTICRKYKISNLFWYIMSSLSISLSLGTTLFNLYYKDPYFWSPSKLICLPFPKLASNNGTYVKFTYILFMARFLISLIIIVFCYFNLNLVYNKYLTLKIRNGDSKHALTEGLVISDGADSPTKESLYFEDNNTDAKIARIKFWTTLKLTCMILAYIVCILPNATVSLSLALNPRNIDPDITTFSHIFNSFSGIINALFVLLIHDPTRKQVDKVLSKFSFKSKTNGLQSAFPYSS